MPGAPTHPTQRLALASKPDVDGGRKSNGKTKRGGTRSHPRNQVRISQTTQRTAGERLSRAQRCGALRPGGGRNRVGARRSLEAHTVSRQEIQSGAQKFAEVRTCIAGGRNAVAMSAAARN